MSNQSPFKWRHFEAEIILLCVRWYLRYALSYRNLEEMMLERRLQVDHTTIYDSVAKILSSSEKAYSKIPNQVSACSEKRGGANFWMVSGSVGVVLSLGKFCMLRRMKEID